MGHQEITFFYEDQVDYRKNHCIYKELNDKKLKGSLFYQGINNDKSYIPIVEDNEEAKHYEISLKIVCSKVSIVADIFAQPGGRLVHYPDLYLHIYENNGEYVITQATTENIFVIATNKEYQKMTITSIDKEFNIHNIEFYYHGDPLDFDIELIQYQLNGEDYIKSELDIYNRRPIRMWFYDNKEMTVTIDYPLFKDMISVPIIIVEDSKLRMNNLTSLEENSYLTLYQFTKRSLSDSLHSKIITKNETNKDIRTLLDIKNTEDK